MAVAAPSRARSTRLLLRAAAQGSGPSMGIATALRMVRRHQCARCEPSEALALSRVRREVYAGQLIGWVASIECLCIGPMSSVASAGWRCGSIGQGTGARPARCRLHPATRRAGERIAWVSPNRAVGSRSGVAGRTGMKEEMEDGRPPTAAVLAQMLVHAPGLFGQNSLHMRSSPPVSIGHRHTCWLHYWAALRAQPSLMTTGARCSRAARGQAE